jgi:hypothetical protein
MYWAAWNLGGGGAGGLPGRGMGNPKEANSTMSAMIKSVQTSIMVTGRFV